jgi:RsiW-degrading membrane proteinase PrsW (M82 family)
LLAGKSAVLPALAGFLTAAGLHGFYDFLVLRQAVLALPIAAALIVAIWIWRLRLMQKMHEQASKNSGR